jgi:hypothetical protein
MNWLNENLIKNDLEVIFIKSTISQGVEIAQRAVLEPVVGRETMALKIGGVGSSSWIGKYPRLHLIHAVIDDNDIKAAYLGRLNLPSGRMAIEQRNTQAAMESNVWHMVANKWNDLNFLPVTSVKSDTHSNFARPISLSFETVSTLQPATMEKVKEKWNSMNLALKHGIQRWDRSGQGDGGFDKEDALVEEDEDASDEREEDDDKDGYGNRFGRLKKRPQQTFDLRCNFFMVNQLTSSTCGKYLRKTAYFSCQCNSYTKTLDPGMEVQEFLL